MIVLKDDDIVYIAFNGTPSLSSGSADSQWYFHEDNLPFWKIQNDEIIIAVSGCGFVRDIFRYDEDFIRGELTMDKIIVETLPKIKKALSIYDSLKENGDTNSSFVFAQKGRAFVLTPKFQCLEIDNFYVSGTGSLYASSTFNISKGKTPEQRLLFANEMIDRGMNFPPSSMTVINTKTCTPYFIK